MFKLIKLFSVFFVITSCLFAFSSNAQQIKSLRAYHNTQKSRVVIDLKDNPNYSYSLSKSGDVFIIRITIVMFAIFLQLRTVKLQDLLL